MGFAGMIPVGQGSSFFYHQVFKLVHQGGILRRGFDGPPGGFGFPEIADLPQEQRLLGIEPLHGLAEPIPVLLQHEFTGDSIDFRAGEGQQMKIGLTALARDAFADPEDGMGTGGSGEEGKGLLTVGGSIPGGAAGQEEGGINRDKQAEPLPTISSVRIRLSERIRRRRAGRYFLLRLFFGTVDLNPPFQVHPK